RRKPRTGSGASNRGGRRARDETMTQSAAPSPSRAPHDAMDYVALHAKLRPNKLACVDLDGAQRLTYAQLDARVERAVSFLRQVVGDPRGERISTLARNRSDLVVLQLACARAGAIYTPLNWRLAAPEIAFLVEDGSPRILVYDADFDHLAEGLAEKHPGM